MGRPLIKPECVHHINLVKTDNSEENLYLCRDIAHHQRVHRSIDALLPLLLERGVIHFDRDGGVYRIAGETGR